MCHSLYVIKEMKREMSFSLFRFGVKCLLKKRRRKNFVSASKTDYGQGLVSAEMLSLESRESHCQPKGRKERCYFSVGFVASSLSKGEGRYVVFNQQKLLLGKGAEEAELLFVGL